MDYGFGGDNKTIFRHPVKRISINIYINFYKYLYKYIGAFFACMSAKCRPIAPPDALPALPRSTV